MRFGTATLVMALALVAPDAGASLGACDVKVRIVNRCPHEAEVHEAEFWHPASPRRYAIPGAGALLKAGQGKAYTYSVLMGCEAAKRGEVRYSHPAAGAKAWKYRTVRSEPQRGRRLTVQLTLCKGD